LWGAPDDREVPDTFSAIYEYPKDKAASELQLLLRQRLFRLRRQFLGSEGMLEVIDRKKAELLSAKVNGKAVKDRQEVHMDYLKDFNQPDATADHVTIS